MIGLRKTMKKLNDVSQPSGMKIKPKIFLIYKTVYHSTPYSIKYL
jgi:hypothetical protein